MSTVETEYRFPCELTEDTLASGMRMSELAGWNQTREDWMTFYRLGRLRGIMHQSDIVGTIGLLPLGKSVSWISLVLVDPDHRGKGLASRMMSWAMECAASEGWTAMLDATAEGARVYRKFGFEGIGEIHRTLVSCGKPGSHDKGSDKLERLGIKNMPFLSNYEFKRTGLNREGLYTHWMQFRDVTGIMTRNSGGSVEAFSFSRSGRLHPYIGPLMAESESLIRDHLRYHFFYYKKPVLMDLTGSGLKMLQDFSDVSVERRRDFIRMAERGNGHDIPWTQIAIAGPEFG